MFILKHPIEAFQIYQAAQNAIETTWIHLKSSHNYEDDLIQEGLRKKLAITS